MTLPVLDADGNLHRGRGVGGGQFEPRVVSAPAGSLAVPEGGWVDETRLRSTFTALWSEIRGEGEGGGVSGEAKRSVLEVAVRKLSADDAPVAVEVSPEHAAPEARGPYRRVDGDLFRQVFDDPHSGREGQSPLPVAADEAWLAQTAEDHARGLHDAGLRVRDPREVQDRVQDHLDGYASVDGEVWVRSTPPVYRVPRAEDIDVSNDGLFDPAPVAAPGSPAAGATAARASDTAQLADTTPAASSVIGLTVVPAPETEEHAALGYFPASRYEDALEEVAATAARLGVPSAPDPVTPPIVWLAELGLVGEGSWREGARLVFDPSSSLTVETFAERFERFRQQIVEHLPESVSGDVGAFQVVPRFRLDRSAMTATQYAEYRRYVMFALDNGLI